jgi:hypothetical protein
VLTLRASVHTELGPKLCEKKTPTKLQIKRCKFVVRGFGFAVRGCGFVVRGCGFAVRGCGCSQRTWVWSRRGWICSHGALICSQRVWICSQRVWICSQRASWYPRTQNNMEKRWESRLLSKTKVTNQFSALLKRWWSLYS